MLKIKFLTAAAETGMPENDFFQGKRRLWLILQFPSRYGRPVFLKNFC